MYRIGYAGSLYLPPPGGRVLYWSSQDHDFVKKNAPVVVLNSKY